MSSLTNNPVIRYFKESREELAKVTWPTRREALNHTALVVVISLGVAAFFGLVDYLLTIGLEQLLKLKK